jgi:hypothetical protein
MCQGKQPHPRREGIGENQPPPLAIAKNKKRMFAFVNDPEIEAAML